MVHDHAASVAQYLGAIDSVQKTATNRAAIYVKANAGDSPDGAERETQMAESERLCRNKGLNVVARYDDDLNGRGEFQRMMADATGENPTLRSTM